MKYIVCIIVTSFLFSCSTTEQRPKVVNNSVGYASELSVTCDAETYKYLREGIGFHIATDQKYITPTEPFYKVNFISVGSFEGSYLEYHLQLFIITEDNKEAMRHLGYAIGEDFYDSITSTDKVSFTQLNNVWAKNQSVFFLYGPSKETLRLYLKEYTESIRQQLYAAELANFGLRIGSYKHPMSKVLKSELGIEMAFPRFTKIDIKKERYYSVNWKEPDANCNLLISVLDSNMAAPSSKESMLQSRINQGKKYLQMDTLGIFYIGTSRLFEQAHKEYVLNGYKGAKINGWWDIDGKFRGGPYTRYTFFHEPTQQWIAMEALVFFPNFKDKKDGKTKTRYLRTMESIIHTLK